MKKLTKTNKMLIAVSSGFICLMLAVSMVLYLGDTDAAKVESQNAQVGETYQLEDMELLNSSDAPMIPLSKFDADAFEAEVMALQVEVAGLSEAQMTQEVPEPATLSLLLVGGLGLITRYRRRRG